MEEIIYLNGNLMPLHQAKISVTDYGFLYGYGLFETMRAYNGTVFRLSSHLARLAGSAAFLKIPMDVPHLEKAVLDCLRANRIKEARIRLTISAGEGRLIPDPRSCGSPTVLVAATTYIPYSREIYSNGFRTLISSLRRNSNSPLPGMKTLNYLENLLARQEAVSSGVDDVLLLNDNGYLAEASTSNVFVVSNNKLKTPGKQAGLLAGITRNIVLELAGQLDIQVFEGEIDVDGLLAADEVFLTSSLMEIMPVAAINGKIAGSGKPGKTTRKLMAAYRELVHKETRG
jgi:branched-chain amino acid aminotransferase